MAVIVSRLVRVDCDLILKDHLEEAINTQLRVAFAAATINKSVTRFGIIYSYEVDSAEGGYRINASATITPVFYCILGLCLVLGMVLPGLSGPVGFVFSMPLYVIPLVTKSLSGSRMKKAIDEASREFCAASNVRAA